MNQQKKTVSFRLEPEVIQLLDELAARHGESRGEAARRLVVDAVTDVGAQNTAERLDDLGKQVKQLQVSLATATMVLLAKAGQASDADARRWVERNLL